MTLTYWSIWSYVKCWIIPIFTIIVWNIWTTFSRIWTQTEICCTFCQCYSCQSCIENTCIRKWSSSFKRCCTSCTCCRRLRIAWSRYCTSDITKRRSIYERNIQNAYQDWYVNKQEWINLHIWYYIKFHYLFNNDDL